MSESNAVPRHPHDVLRNLEGRMAPAIALLELLSSYAEEHSGDSEDEHAWFYSLDINFMDWGNGFYRNINAVDALLLHMINLFKEACEELGRAINERHDWEMAQRKERAA